MNINNPYIQMANLAGTDAPFQNTAAQQSMYQQNMSNMGNLAQQALDTKGTSQVAFDPKAMAEALRAGKDVQQPAPVIDKSTPMSYDDLMKQYYGNSYNPDAGWSM